MARHLADLMIEKPHVLKLGDEAHLRRLVAQRVHGLAHRVELEPLQVEEGLRLEQDVLRAREVGEEALNAHA